MSTLLEVEDLRTYFKSDHGLVKALDGVSYRVHAREIIGLVGESGCGKSVSLLSVLRLIPVPPGKIVGGKVTFQGKDLMKLDPKGNEMRSIRGGKIGMIFQEPMTSLNPVLTIGRQVTEGLELHLSMKRQTAKDRAAELLNMVGIPDAGKRMDDYPHQFSGGMRQRVMIAMAMSCNPQLIFADEPTTALDVTTQAQLLELMKEMVSRLSASLLIVTHNLGVVARYAQRLYVMYAGRVVESGTSKEIFGQPCHPYTISLLKCVPRLDEEAGRKLVPIKGMPPNLVNMAPTCAFAPRCPNRLKRCRIDPSPELRFIGGQHYVSCHADSGM